jgi:hypothetical protein
VFSYGNIIFDLRLFYLRPVFQEHDYDLTEGTKWLEVAVRVIIQRLKLCKINSNFYLATVDSWQHGLGAHLF